MRDAVAERHRETLLEPVLRVEVERIAEHDGDGAVGIAQRDARAVQKAPA